MPDTLPALATTPVAGGVVGAGGLLVLLSYALPFAWPSVRENGRRLFVGLDETGWYLPAFLVSTALAAAGFVALAYWAVFVRPHATTTLGLGLFLLFSAMWMPLTLCAQLKDSPSARFLVGCVLVVVAALALFVTWSHGGIEPAPTDWRWVAALVGGIVLTLHVSVLDALVWLRAFLRYQ
jgi:hypothetical protein